MPEPRVALCGRCRVCGALSLVWWHSFPLHTLILALMIFLSSHNGNPATWTHRSYLGCILLKMRAVSLLAGATYTFRVFLSRYEAQLLAKNPDILRIPSVKESK